MYQPAFVGVVAAVTGFAGSFVFVIAGLQAVGATDSQAASVLLAPCLLVGIDGVLYPEADRQCDARRHPVPICPAPVTAAVQQPLLAVPVVLVWLAVFKLARAWMVPATMVVAAIIDVRLPASALRDLVGSGLANAFGSVVGALGINLTAITTAPMAGPDAHPDGPKRWIATAASGAACLVLVTASGVSVLGIGSAFGGLVIGGVVMLWPGWMPSGRSHPTAVAAP